MSLHARSLTESIATLVEAAAQELEDAVQNSKAARLVDKKFKARDADPDLWDLILRARKRVAFWRGMFAATAADAASHAESSERPADPT